jgi:hypothetical protein
MISVIVLVPGGAGRGELRDGELLARSLVWLVSAVVAGIVRDVILAGPEGAGLADIAEQAGCTAVVDDREAECLTKAVASSRQPRLLILQSAFQPGDGMVGELDGLVRMMRQDQTASLLAAPVTAWQGLLPGRARTVGLLAPTNRCRSLAGSDFRRLKARLRPKIKFVTRANPIF